MLWQSRISSVTILIRTKKNHFLWFYNVSVYFVVRMLAVTMALTQMQWKTVAVCVWVTAKAVRWSTSHLMKKKAWVSPELRGQLG